MKRICSVALHIDIYCVGLSGIEKLVEHVGGHLPPIKWDFEEIHYFDNGPLTAQYMLVLDALNFCFWPGMRSFHNIGLAYRRLTVLWRTNDSELQLICSSAK